MFSTEFLHRVREYEIAAVSRHFFPGARLLEIGGGTGFQTRWLLERGFRIASVDIPVSTYREERVGPVIEYDGRRLPFKDGSFDVVFTSNTLEHVGELAPFHREVCRVLSKEGYCLHAMPSSTWRFWTSLASYVELGQHLLRAIPSLVPRRPTPREVKRSLGVLWSMATTMRAYAIPPRHGEVGNAITELWTFSRRRWVQHFLTHRFDVLDVEPMGLFYTGHMVLGPRWPLRWRQIAAGLLGSACILYKVRPHSAYGGP